MIVSVALCTNSILDIWTEWNGRPVTVNINDKTTSIGMISFPAITICSKEKSDTNKVYVDRLVNVLKAAASDDTTSFLNLTAKE